ncbi:peptidyl serine alpha-galactosyltransferase isoform X2 [Solanum lycopersicum]|uniref:Hydroxyproline O-arabinosyltransferase-like domain-containing protein n=1 Tax=Solanum lycopersicum TaxID=4081 RepID=A0A3Q7GES1_SOLLC|nr:peptidyl serine alpha-galactosyltransferase [Solanum lycopersicum]
MMEKKAILVFLVLTLSLISGQEPEKIDTQKAPWRIHTLFSVECQNYFDWQTVGLMHSYRKAQQPGPITRLLSCTEDERKGYRGMELAPTFEVPSMSRHPKTGDWYPAINKPAGVVHWLKYSKEAENVDWVVILDADMIIRGPIVPWEIGAEKGKPVSAYYGYLIGCDNILAKLHTKHPEFCDKVGGLLAMHIDDLRALAPLWLSKTEEVREDRAHWPTNYTGDIYGTGWISEMYGYSFGAAEVGLRHKINDNLMIYPGYTPREGVEPILMHYGLPFNVGNWSFSKLDHHEDDIVYDCSRLFPEPPYPREITQMESDHNKRRALFLNIECINTMNEGLLLQHAAFKCPKPKWSKYLSFLKSKTFAELSRPKHLTPQSRQMMEIEIHEEVNKEPEKPPPKIEVKIHKEVVNEPEKPHPKIHTIFSTECSSYFDWQTVGLVHSFYKSGQPGNITRLLSCTDEDLKQYKGHDLAPTHYVPSMSRHPLTGDWYPAINKPAAVLHWMNHVKTDAEYIVILDADMIMRGPITPWEFNAGRSRPASTPYDYLIGCDNILAKLHTRHPEACDKVGGVIIMHVDDLRKFALQWLHKTMEVRLDRSHWSKNITGDIYESGWISEMYGYSFGAAELNLRHVISDEILIYPGYVPKPGVNYRVFHYGLEYRVGKWSFDKANWRHTDLVNKCWAKFPDPPDPSSLDQTDNNSLQRDLLSVECATTLNEALRLHHERRKCPDPNTISTPKHDRVNQDRVDETRTNAETRRASAETRTNAETRTSAESRTNADTKTDAETRTNSETRADDEIRTNAEARMAVETTTSTKFGGVDEVQAFRHDEMPKNSSQESSQVETSNGTFTSMRFWIMVLWGVSIFGFLGVMSVMLKGRKGLKKRGKGYKSKRRTTYSGFWDTNGQDRHLRNAETA